MSQYYSYSETTERESLLDYIVVRAARDVPLLASLPRTTLKNRVTEWSIDRPFQSSENARLISNPHVNSRLEGAAFGTTRTPFFPTRLKAICEIQADTMEMSGTDRTVDAAGMNSTWDYRSGQLYTLHLNRIDNVLMYGQGSSVTGSATDPRMCQGLLSWSAITGLERIHGTKTEIMDPYGVTIQDDDFSVFYDAEHAPVTASMFYQQITRRVLAAGGNWDRPWRFMCGYGLVQSVARFLIADGGTPINDRNVDAASGGGYDFVNWIKMPSGHVVAFQTNRWLDDEADTFTINNTDYTPTSPTTEGTINKTFDGDQTMIGWEPGTVTVGWLREPGFRKVETSSDNSQIAIVSEFTLLVDAPLCVAGLGNAAY